jgi:hypothetical protein
MLYCIGVWLTLFRKPSPDGEGWGEENKINYLYSPSSQPSPSREKELAKHLCKYLCPKGEGDKSQW